MRLFAIVSLIQWCKLDVIVDDFASFDRTINLLAWKWNLSLISGWLDDIGLPQYKDQFHEGRVDGRMIQYLTVVRTCTSCICLLETPSQLVMFFSCAFRMTC